jgi:hypothetical protein
MLIKNDKRYIISFLIVILFNLVLLKLPLTSVFGYEFSVLNSILLVLISGYLLISFRNKNENYLKQILTISPLLLFIPLIISLLNSLLTTTCSIIDGFLFYLVITVPAIIIGSSLGLLSFYISPKYPRIVFNIILLIMVSIPVIEIYYNPQIYFYNPLIGYFPGTIYDEGLRVTWKLIYYRTFNLILFIFIFFSLGLILKNKIKLSRILFLTIILVLVSVFIFCSPYFGFSTTKKSTESLLKGKYYTKHFEIIYDTSIDTTYLKNVIINHEFYYFDLKKFFQEEPDRKITSFIFKDNKQKGAIFGSENADVAKPWLYQIYTTAGNYDNTLRHEIAHIFTASFGTTPFKIAKNFNPALIEGIAEAAAPLYNTWYIDQIASIAYNNNYKLSLVDLYSGFRFFGQTSGLSYVYAGSFTNYLINRFGIEKFKVWYKGGSFSNTYGLDLKIMESNYYNYLEQLGFTNKKNTAQFYFGRQTIFSKFCPRYIASQLLIGWNNFNNDNFIEAESVFSSINNLTQNYSALYGLLLSKVELKKEKEALYLLSQEITKYKNSSYYYYLELLNGDLLVRNKEFEKAKEQYFLLNSQNPDMHFNYLSKLRLNLCSNDSLIYKYITANDTSKYEILRKYNIDSYDYSSIPVLIDLAIILHKSYQEIITQFNRNLIVNDIVSSYATYYLSKYMMENLDYSGYRKIATLAARYLDADGIQLFLRSNLIKANWMFFNSGRIINDELHANSSK